MRLLLFAALTFFLSFSVSGQRTYPEHDGYLDSFYCVNGEKYVMEKTDRRGIFGNPRTMREKVIKFAHEFAEKEKGILKEIDTFYTPTGPGQFAFFRYTFTLSNKIGISSNENINSDTSSNKNDIRIRISDNRVDISKVAVIGKESTLCDGTKDDGQGLAELVEGELLGLYGVVERKYLEEILDEQRLAMSGLLIEDTDFATAGCLAGAQGTVLASYGCLQGKTKLQVKLVDCSTSDLYWSATGLDVSEFDLLDALRSKLE